MPMYLKILEDRQQVHCDCVSTIKSFVKRKFRNSSKCRHVKGDAVHRARPLATIFSKTGKVSSAILAGSFYITIKQNEEYLVRCENEKRPFLENLTKLKVVDLDDVNIGKLQSGK